MPKRINFIILECSVCENDHNIIWFPLQININDSFMEMFTLNFEFHRILVRRKIQRYFWNANIKRKKNYSWNIDEREALHWVNNKMLSKKFIFLQISRGWSIALWLILILETKITKCLREQKRFHQPLRQNRLASDTLTPRQMCRILFFTAMVANCIWFDAVRCTIPSV